MKGIWIIFITVLLLILCVSLVGCSPKEKPADQTLQPDSQTSLTAETVMPADQNTIVPESAWTLVKDFQVTHYNFTMVEGFADENNGITVGTYNKAHCTADGGKTWALATGIQDDRFGLDIINENLAWCGGWHNTICFSKDGGKSWTQTPENFISTNKVTLLSFLDDTTGWVASYSEFGSTRDGGKTWTNMKLPDGIRRIGAIYLLTPEIGYLLSLDGQFLATEDSGQTWSKQDLNFSRFNIMDQNNKSGWLVETNVPVADMSFSDENNGFIIFIGCVPKEGYKAWMLSTTDGGATWTDEQILTGEDFKLSTLHLTRDGKYLTLSDTKKRVNVLKHK